MGRKKTHSGKLLAFWGMAILGVSIAAVVVTTSQAQTSGPVPLQVADIDAVLGMQTSNPLANYAAGDPAYAGQEIKYENAGISIFVAPSTQTTPITTDGNVPECGHLGIQSWQGANYAYKLTDGNTWQKRRTPCAGIVVIGSSEQIRAQTLTIKGTSVEGKAFTLQVNVPDHTTWDQEVGGGNRRLYVDDTGATYSCYSSGFSRIWPNECEFSPSQALARAPVGSGFGTNPNNGLCQAGETIATAPQDCADTTPPTLAAGGIAATNVTSSAVTLTWAAAADNTGVTGYKLFRNDYLINTITELTHTDTGLSASTAYSYYIKAVDAAGNESAPSATVTITTTAPTCDGFNLSLANNKTSYAQGETVTYTYTCYPAGTRAASSTVQVVKPDGTATTYNTGTNIDTATLGFSTSNLAAGTYTLRVCLDPACPANGIMQNITFTVTASSTTSDTPATGRVTQLFPGQYSNTKFSITIDDADGIKEFSVKKANSTSIYGGSPGAAGNVGACGGANTYKTITSGTVTLEPADFPLNMTVTDCKTNAAAYSTTIQSLTTATTTPPTAPSGLTATVVSNGTVVNLSWTDNSSNETGFRVYRKIISPNLTEWIQDGTTPSGVSSYTATPSHAGTFEYKVTAYILSGAMAPESTSSNVVSATTTGSATTGTTTPSNSNWVQHTWTFSDGTSQSSILNRTDSDYLNYIALVDAACKLISQNKFTWKSGAGDDSATNWQNFGIPDCSGTGTTTTPTTPTTPSGTLYCPQNTGTTYGSSYTSKCGEPDTTTDLTAESGSGFWCGGGGTAFYSSTKAYCPPKSGGTSSYGMLTSAEIKATLKRLGPGWKLCNPFMNSGSMSSTSMCGEPGETIPSDGWCAWMPPSSTYYSPLAPGSPRTCPQLDDTTTVKDTPTPLPVPPTPEPGTPRECAVGEWPMSTVATSIAPACRTPMYRFNLNAKTWEKCDAAQPQTWTEVKGNSKAQYTNCESFGDFELEKEWKTERFIAHDPRIDGEWYMPPWDATAKQFQYNPKTDSFEQCAARAMTSTYAPGAPMEYIAPCSPVPEKDRSWLLKKARAEHAMYQRWNDVSTGTTTAVLDSLEDLLPTPLPVAPLPKITKEQCPAYLAGIRQTNEKYKEFWRNTRMQLRFAPKDYANLAAVNTALNEAQKTINEVGKLARGTQCNEELIGKLSKQTTKLETDLSQLASFIPEIDDLADYNQCLNTLGERRTELERLAATAKNAEAKSALTDETEAIAEKIVEFRKTSPADDFSVTFVCEEFLDETEAGVASLIRANHEEINTLIETVLLEKFKSFIEERDEKIMLSEEKINRLLVQVAELQTTIGTLTKAAEEFSAKIAVSYTALGYIDAKFDEERTHIQAAKDTFIPLVKNAAEAMKSNSCIRTADQERVLRQLGEIAAVNWAHPEDADALAKRLSLFINTCKAKEVTPADVASLIAQVENAATDNQNYSYERGLTRFRDVRTNTYYLGGMNHAFDRGIMTQGRPGESVLRQDALLMELRAAGVQDDELTGRCSAPSGVRAVSDYATCAARYAASHGVALNGSLQVAASRYEIAQWIVKLVPGLEAGTEADLEGYTDLGGLSAAERIAIATMIRNNIMVGQISSTNKAWSPRGPVVRADLAVILDKPEITGAE